MATEPQRPIEKLLRACAEKRRQEAGAPFELTPEARRKLLHEVRGLEEDLNKQQALGWGPRLNGLWTWLFSGQKRGQTAGPRGWPFAVFGRPAVLGSLAVVAVLAVTAVVWVHSLNKGQPAALMARNDQPANRRFAPSFSAPSADQIPKSPAIPTESATAQRTEPAGSVYDAVGEKQGAARSLETTALPTAPQDKAEVLTQEGAAQYSLPSVQPPGPPAPAAPQNGPSSYSPPLTLKSLVAKDGSGSSTADQKANEPSGSTGLSASASYYAYQGTVQRSQMDIAASPVTAAQPAPAAESRKAQSAATTLHFARTQPAAETDSASARKQAEAPSGSATIPVAAVLASFDFEQSGEEIRIVDSDGSVYTGSVPPEPSAAQADSLGARRSGGFGGGAGARSRAAPQNALASSNRQTAQGYSFSVSGTNRSLNQGVVFTFNLLPATNGTAQMSPTYGALAGRAGGMGGGGSGGRRSATDQYLIPQSAATPQPAIWISGQLKIGSSQETRIDAIREPARTP